MQKYLYRKIEGLSKNQRSSLISSVKILTAKLSSFSSTDILKKIIEEFEYKTKVSNSFEWLSALLIEKEFISDLKYLIQANLFKIERRKKVRPFLEKQKLLLKEQRSKAIEWRQSKEKPTEKQLKYCKTLCRQLNIAEPDFVNLSKLELKHLISEFVEKKRLLH